MLDTSRRLLVVGLFLLAVLGVAPWLPKVFGYTSAIVNNYAAGTYYPATNPDASQAPFISCEQFPRTNEFNKNADPAATNYVRCTNNWGSAITLTWSKVSGHGGVTVSGSATVPAGSQNYCVPIDFSFSNAGNGVVVYQGTINQSDLSGTIQFDGELRFKGGPSTVLCTP